MVSTLGADTIRSIATAGPDMQASRNYRQAHSNIPCVQVKLLQSLGLQSTLITDGTTPINLFNTARGLIDSTSVGGAIKRATPRTTTKRSGAAVEGEYDSE